MKIRIYKTIILPVVLHGCETLSLTLKSQKERDHWEDQDAGGWTILKWIVDRMGWYGFD
jgi:hypothetical protein